MPGEGSSIWSKEAPVKIVSRTGIGWDEASCPARGPTHTSLCPFTQSSLTTGMGTLLWPPEWVAHLTQTLLYRTSDLPWLARLFRLVKALTSRERRHKRSQKHIFPSRSCPRSPRKYASLFPGSSKRSESIHKAQITNHKSSPRPSHHHTSHILCHLLILQ